MKKINIIFGYILVFLLSVITYLMTIDAGVSLAVFVLLFLVVFITTLSFISDSEKEVAQIKTMNIIYVFIAGSLFHLGFFTLGINIHSSNTLLVLQRFTPLILLCALLLGYILMVPFKLIRFTSNYKTSKLNLVVDLSVLFISISGLIFLIFFSPVFQITLFYGLYYYFGLFGCIPLLTLLCITKSIQLYVMHKKATQVI